MVVPVSPPFPLPWRLYLAKYDDLETGGDEPGARQRLSAPTAGPKQGTAGRRNISCLGPSNILPEVTLGIPSMADLTTSEEEGK
jgi:hypothetical protein